MRLHFNKVGLFILINLITLTSCFNQELSKVEFPKEKIEEGVSTPIEQLRSFPSPRYAANHSLLRNYNWISSIHFLGGLPSDTTLSKKEKIKNAVAVQKELATNWNYYIHLGNAKKLANANMKNVETEPYAAFINLANQHPELPVSVTTFWLQANMKQVGQKVRRPHIHRKDLGESMYVKGYKTAHGHPIISFAAPDSFFRIDGSAQKLYFDKIAEKLTRPINIVNENGETRPHRPIKPVRLKKDENLVKDFNQSGEKDWGIYQAKNKLRFRQAFRDAFLFDSPIIDSCLFTWYAMDGNDRHRFDWSVSRQIMSPINGQYYSTGDFYPRWTSNWRKGKGAWHGWNWYVGARKNELATGDKLCSPFIAAGWDKNPEKNIRPSQWLALLKHLNVTGAEFFYTGFFNLKKPFPKPENYIWQAVIPSYAQAITSRYEEILRNGDILKDVNGDYIFEVPTDNNQALVTVRKHDTESKYIIVGSLQPNLLTLGELPAEEVVTATIDGFNLKFKVRRQGCVYLADFSEGQEPVFYQLDEWHELGHPQKWTDDIHLEGELFESNDGCILKTDVKNASPKNYDFSNSTTSLVLESEDSKVGYSLQTNSDNQGAHYKLILKSRSLNSKRGRTINCYLDGEKLGNITLKKNSNWGDYELKDQSNLLKTLDNKKHLLEFDGDAGIEIDKILIKKI